MGGKTSAPTDTSEAANAAGKPWDLQQAPPCPLCGKEMVLRWGNHGKPFWGCVDYFPNESLGGCLGKRNLDGSVSGIDGEYPNSLGPVGREMFDVLSSEDEMTFDERQEISEAWEHDEENDHFW